MIKNSRRGRPKIDDTAALQWMTIMKQKNPTLSIAALVRRLPAELITNVQSETARTKRLGRKLKGLDDRGTASAECIAPMNTAPSSVSHFASFRPDPKMIRSFKAAANAFEPFLKNKPYLRALERVAKQSAGLMIVFKAIRY